MCSEKERRAQEELKKGVFEGRLKRGGASDDRAWLERLHREGNGSPAIVTSRTYVGDKGVAFRREDTGEQAEIPGNKLGRLDVTGDLDRRCREDPTEVDEIIDDPGTDLAEALGMTMND